MNIKNIFLTPFLIVFFSSGAFTQGSKTVKWISSTNTTRWEWQPDLTINQTEQTSSDKVEIYADKPQQLIEGFGGCFNEKGWDALQSLDKNTQDSILSELFQPGKGCCFTICRMPIGASDYAQNWYSLDDTYGDYEMKHFNIERDQRCLIPYIKAAKKYNPGLRIWASPWSPPVWLKTNNNYACKKSSKNDLRCCEGKKGVTLFKMDDASLKAYAVYFSKFITAYREQGIEVYAVHVQNEFNSCQIFPSCIWNTTDMNRFIGSYLGPQFTRDGLSTEIWLGTIERPSIAKIDTILSDPISSKYIKGMGFQWGGRGALTEAHYKYPKMKIMQTETECGNGSNDWAAARHTFGLMKFYLSRGANSYMYWNMILDQSGKSTWGWKQNAMIVINQRTQKVTFTPEFYLMKHFSHFIDSGAHNLNTSDLSRDIIAFQNPDGKIIIVTSNNNKQNKNVVIKIGNKSFSADLKAFSFNTFIVD